MKAERTCRRWRSMGNSAKAWTANKIRAKTAKSSDRREARTTEDEIAAFIDRTDVSLKDKIKKKANSIEI